MSDLAETVQDIRDHHRTRNFAMDQRKRADLALGAYLRTQLGWRKIPEGLTKKEGAEIDKVNKVAAAQADAIITVAEKMIKEKMKPEGKAKPVDLTGVEHFDRLGFVALAAVESRYPFTKIEDGALKEMEKLAKTLPVWSEFGEPIKGFGAASLAVIVAEAGDLSRFSNPGKLWKRMGLAPRVGNDGKMHLPSAFKKNDLTTREWSELGYNRRRRSRMFSIADSLLKHQSEYRDYFLEIRADEHRKAVLECLIPATSTATTVEGWANLGLPELTLVKKVDPDLHRSAAHMTARARVKTEKRLLKHLWQNWRRLQGQHWEEPENFRVAA